ncbi:MAG: hypothetical protein WCW52_11405 [Elusimicrobiales bacterium]
MLKIAGKSSKTRQYAIGGVVAVIILCVWISIPLMHNSSMDSSVSPANFFKTRTADVGSLGNDIPQEGGAPGYALNGAMLNNPATSGENVAASLFQSGPGEEPAAEGETAAVPAGSAVPVPGTPASSKVLEPAFPGVKGKLSAVPSITAGNSNSMTAGGAHNRFFGSGAAKPDFAPAVPDQVVKNTPAAEKRGALMAMLRQTEEKSAQAAKSFNSAAAAGAATSAFEKTSKTDLSGLNTEMERGAASSGLALGAAAQDLKRSDPQLNKTKVTLPEPVVSKEEDMDKEIQKMLIQMVIGSVLGPMFSTVFGAAMGVSDMQHNTQYGTQYGTQQYGNQYGPQYGNQYDTH